MTTNTFGNLEALDEINSEDDAKSKDSENIKTKPVDNAKEKKPISPPFYSEKDSDSTDSKNIPIMQTSPPVLSRDLSPKKRSQKKSGKGSSLGEFDDFFENVQDIMFCYDEEKSYSQKRESEITVDQSGLMVNTETSPNQIEIPESMGNFSKGKRSVGSPKSVDFNLNFKSPKKYYRKKLPYDLRGKKEKELEELTGIKNLLFVNKKRNFGCGYTLKSVVSLAELSIYK